jgi:hypothetical protein
MKLFLVLAFAFLGSLGHPLWAQTSLSNDVVLKLVKTGLSEELILNLIDHLVNQRPRRVATDAAKLIELKRVGLTEPAICDVVEQNPPTEPLTTDAIVHLAKAGFSRSFITSLLSRQYRKSTSEVPQIVGLNESVVSERILAAMIAEPASPELPAGTEISIRLIDSDPILLADFVVVPDEADAMERPPARCRFAHVCR